MTGDASAGNSSGGTSVKRLVVSLNGYQIEGGESLLLAAHFNLRG